MEGRYAEADKELRKLIDDPSTFEIVKREAQSILSTTYIQQGRFREAELSLKSEISQREKSQESNSAVLCSSLISLSKLYIAQYRYSQAKELLEQAKQIATKNYSNSNPRRAEVYLQLAKVYHRLDEAKSAKGLYEETLEIYERCYGESHPELLVARMEYAVFLSETGDSEIELSTQTEKLEQKIAVIQRARMPSDLKHRFFFQLSDIFTAQGRFLEAYSALDQAINIVESTGGASIDLMYYYTARAKLRIEFAEHVIPGNKISDSTPEQKKTL